MHILRSIPIILLMLLLVFPAALSAADIRKDQGWHQSYTTLLDVDFKGTGFHARWEYFHCSCGDILIRLEQTAPDGLVAGELLVVDGQVLLARGLGPISTDLEPLVQAPTLMMQLAFRLLQRTIVDGPASVKKETGIDLTEERLSLKLETGLARGEFEAPWSVTGKAWPIGEGKLRFNLDFDFSVTMPDGQTVQEDIGFTGGQDYVNDNFPLPGGSDLDGWLMQWISKGELEPVPAPAGLTLDELRSQAQALSNPEA